MDNEMISVRTLEEHYGVWRWRLERSPSNVFVELWRDIAASSLQIEPKLALTNIAWGLAAFERSYQVLLANITRAERWHNMGAPASVAFLTGPYGESLDYLVATSLWMDLADVLVSYRTLVNRLGHLRGHIRRRFISMDMSDFDSQFDSLNNKALPEISGDTVRRLADRLVHESWHPGGTSELTFRLYWKGDNPQTVDFAESNAREALDSLIEDTTMQLRDFIRRILESSN